MAAHEDRYTSVEDIKEHLAEDFDAVELVAAAARWTFTRSSGGTPFCATGTSHGSFVPG